MEGRSCLGREREGMAGSRWVDEQGGLMGSGGPLGDLVHRGEVSRPEGGDDRVHLIVEAGMARRDGTVGSVLVRADVKVQEGWV